MYRLCSLASWCQCFDWIGYECIGCVHWSADASVLTEYSYECIGCVHWSADASVLTEYGYECIGCVHWPAGSSVLTGYGYECTSCVHWSADACGLTGYFIKCIGCVDWPAGAWVARQPGYSHSNPGMAMNLLQLQNKPQNITIFEDICLILREIAFHFTKWSQNYFFV